MPLTLWNRASTNAQKSPTRQQQSSYLKAQSLKNTERDLIPIKPISILITLIFLCSTIMSLNVSSQATTRDPYLLLRARALQERRQRQAERRTQADRLAEDHGIVDTPTFRGAALEIQSFRGTEFILAGPSETGKTWAT